MKVAIMGESIAPGMDGQGWFTYHLIQNLSRLNDIELTVVGTKNLDLFDIPAKKILHKKFNFFQKMYVIDMIRRINREGFDIIHSPVNYGLPYFYFVNPIKIKTIIDATGFEIEFGYSLLGKLELKTQYAVFGSKIDRIATISETSKKEIMKHFHFKEDKISVIYLGVGKEFRMIKEEECRKVLERYGIEKPFLFHVSRAAKNKNIDGIIQAFNLVQKDIDCDLVIGGGYKGPSFDHIKVVGYIPFQDLPYFYAGAKAFMFPSFHEGFGLPILESMACGTPVITSNCYATKEIGENAAVLVDPYNTRELANAIVELLSNNSLYCEIKRQGLLRAKEFPWSKCANFYYRLYKMVLNK